MYPKGFIDLKKETVDPPGVLLSATSTKSFGITGFCGFGNSIQADVEEQTCSRLQMFHQQISTRPHFNSDN